MFRMFQCSVYVRILCRKLEYSYLNEAMQMSMFHVKYPDFYSELFRVEIIIHVTFISVIYNDPTGKSSEVTQV